MPSPLSLTVTPGIVVPNSGVRIGHTELNQIANPTVSLAASSAIGPDFLDLPAITAALADTVRGRNYLRRSNFFWEDWKQPDGLSCPAGVLTENALEWYARPTGGTVTVRRVEDSPDSGSTWGATLLGGTGVTSTDFLTWVPSAIAGSLRMGYLTFSLYVFNNEGATATVSPVLFTATTPNERPTASLVRTGTAVSCPAGQWTRVTMTFDAGEHIVQNGFYIGIRTNFLTSTVISINVAQAQLEKASAASPFIRPVLPPDSFANMPVMTDAERANGGMVVVRMSNGELRLLPAPGSLLSPAVIGYNATAGIPEWIDPDGSITVLRYTGTDQTFTVPTGATTMEIHCWGAGASSNTGRPGGVGGYSRGRFPAGAVGTQYAAMVGGPGVFLSTVASYGFGGAGGLQGGGGGLSGVFTGTAAIGFGDAARAFLLAGGGGAVYYDYNNPGTALAGGSGNEPASAGGQLDFRGAASAGGATAGGGGLVGGNALTSGGGASPGRAGTGYLHTGTGPRPISTAGEVSFQLRTTPVTNGQRLIVPGSISPYYQNEAGQTDKPGLIVIVWNPA
jgi:hypothetical protein